MDDLEFDKIVEGLEDEILEGVDKVAFEYGKHVFGECIPNCTYCKYLSS